MADLGVVTKQMVEDFLEDQAPNAGVMDALITSVSAETARYIGRAKWGPQESRTEFHDGDTSYLLVKVWPVLSVTSIHDDVNHDFDASTLIDPENFHIGQRNQGIIYFDNWKLTGGFESAKIIYVGGYKNADAIEESIRTAALLQIEHEISRRIPGQFTDVPGQFESGAFGDFEGINLIGQTRTLLDPFKRKIYFARN